MEIAGISLSEADGQIFLRGQPMPERPAVDAQALRTLLHDAGFGDCCILEESIATAVHDCNTRQNPFVIQIAERRDATVDVEIAPDEMTAQISLKPPQGGKPAAIEDVIRALTQAGVVFGIDQAALMQACEVGQVEHVPVACGAEPQNGQDTQFEELVPQTVDRAPKLDASGLIDYREHAAISLVEPGAELMRRIPPTPGVPGCTIRGATLPPVPGRDEPFAPNLAGATVAASDPNLLKASITGQPVRVPCGVMVEPVLRVPEVNLATGNIYFDGTVQVDGEVNPGMKIQASGDVMVGGTVDGAHIEAGGDIEVGGGVISQASLKAAGAIHARFAQNSALQAGTLIALGEMALECDLQALNQITIGAKAPQRGRLVGGKATTMMLLKVPLLGSGKAGVTQVMVGANPELELKYQALLQRIDAEKANEVNLQKLVHHLTSIGDPKGMLDRVKASWRQAVQVWGKSLAERGELDQQLAHTRQAKVEVGMGTSGMVEIAFGSRKNRLRKEYGNGTFSIDTESRMVFTDPSGQAYPCS